MVGEGEPTGCQATLVPVVGRDCVLRIWDERGQLSGDISEASRLVGGPGIVEPCHEFIEVNRLYGVAEDFMLLSSAKFKLSAAGPVEIDVTERKGLDLILPVACLLPLQRRVEWAEKFDIPMRVLDKLADGAEALAVVLVSKHMESVEKLIAKLPKVGPLVAVAARPLLTKAVGLAGEKLKEIHDEALENKDYLTATLTQFKLDLEQGVADGLPFRSKQ
ncbi:hypothetical protein ACFV9G_23305 [Nocardioides sp. NPDC059952]|uniref:hypothetical protein n=1 Tax=Nocardioides sp. NPDC059952 TaxID=3347014 RepID=UPI003659C8A5